MSFSNRWLIEGSLTTISPLHIGDGEIIPRELSSNEEPVKVSSVVTNASGKPYIPGSTIKGNIRSWLKRHLDDNKLLEQLFGSENATVSDAVGGKAEFSNAYVVCDPNLRNNISYYDKERFTGITVSVSIDRHTRTALDKKLFHQEFVPPGVTFGLTITGQNLEEADIILLLAVLNKGFSHIDPLTMGSSTSDGWGRFSWELTEIKSLDLDCVKQWLAIAAVEAKLFAGLDLDCVEQCLASGDQRVGYDALQPLDVEKRKALLAEADKVSVAATEATVAIELSLKFDGFFLVNDPSIVSDDTKDHRPMKNHAGFIVLPARSFRGAFRSQAERIIRTLNVKACTTLDPCSSIENSDSIKKLCPVCRIFGSTGWRTAVDISDFIQDEQKETITQEFVAIDRFTGGGANHLKFNAEAVPSPLLKGQITFDVCRIKKWGVGLIALTLRDLIEGDITFGFGASKGYGSCRAEITNLSVSSQAEKLLTEDKKRPNNQDKYKWNKDDKTAVALLEDYVREFQSVINTFPKEVANG